MRMMIPLTEDFPLDGRGAHTAWHKAPWTSLPLVGGGSSHGTKVKALYSDTGFYCLFSCEANGLTGTGLPDFSHLYTEDVVELFLQPDARMGLYLEYELSPWNRELPLLVSNNGQSFHGWLPFCYEGKRKTRHACGLWRKKPDSADIGGYHAEIFLPYALMEGLPNTPPRKGCRWSANYCRIDHAPAGGSSCASRWAWAYEAGVEFHDYAKFGEIVFD